MSDGMRIMEQHSLLVQKRSGIMLLLPASASAYDTKWGKSSQMPGHPSCDRPSLLSLLQGHQMAVSPGTQYFPAGWLGERVSGATLGIVGMGSIGYKVASRARAFEMKILYHNRHQR